MPAMRIIAWVQFGLAALLVYNSFDQKPFLLTPAVGAIVSGCLFLAVDRALDLLAQIRDRLPAPARDAETDHPDDMPARAPTRSLSEIEADLQRLRSKSS